MTFPGRIRCFHGLVLAVATVGLGVSIALAARAARQSNSSDQVVEVVATLATGRVTIITGGDGLVVAAVGTAFEPESLPPLIVPLGDSEIAIVLGADDWYEPPPASRTILRLDRQLPHLVGQMAGGAPSLTSASNIAHLDQFGLAVLDPLRAAARNLHAQLHLPDNLPLTEIVLVHRTSRDPLIVWDISYWIQQKFWQENFWDTQVQRPRSTQLYPTRQDRSGVIQIRYPRDDNSPGLLDWLSHPPAAFAQALTTDPKLGAAQQEIAAGKAGKTDMAQLVPLVKTALETMVPATSAKALAAIDDKAGFSWIIQPPVSRNPAKRPSGAPTLGGPSLGE